MDIFNPEEEMSKSQALKFLGIDIGNFYIVSRNFFWQDFFGLFNWQKRKNSAERTVPIRMVLPKKDIVIIERMIKTIKQTQKKWLTASSFSKDIGLHNSCIYPWIKKRAVKVIDKLAEHSDLPAMEKTLAKIIDTALIINFGVNSYINPKKISQISARGIKKIYSATRHEQYLKRKHSGKCKKTKKKSQIRLCEKCSCELRSRKSKKERLCDPCKLSEFED